MCFKGRNCCSSPGTNPAVTVQSAMADDQSPEDQPPGIFASLVIGKKAFLEDPADRSFRDAQEIVALEEENERLKRLVSATTLIVDERLPSIEALEKHNADNAAGLKPENKILIALAISVQPNWPNCNGFASRTLASRLKDRYLAKLNEINIAIALSDGARQSKKPIVESDRIVETIRGRLRRLGESERLKLKAS